MELKCLMVDDDSTVTTNFSDVINEVEFKNFSFILETENDFDVGLEKIKLGNYDLVILDLCRGEPTESNGDKMGETILDEIRKECFIPVIFFTGLVQHVSHLESPFIRVICKTSGGNQQIIDQINDLVNQKLISLRKNLKQFIDKKMKEYFWDFLQVNWEKIKNFNDDISLSYLLIRRLSNSMSKEGAIKLLDDPNILPNKVHPMEFYVYPPLDNTIYENGSILKKDADFYLVLTPSCDLILRNGDRKAKNIMLIKTTKLSQMQEYVDYSSNKSSTNKDKLLRLIEGRKSDQYFFLPGTPFINDLIINFQNIVMIEENTLNLYTIIAKLDYPYGESCLASFVRYYNRIGYPDLDSKYVLSKLFN
jgi:hypothetical protein